MAEHARRRTGGRKPKDEETATGFMAPLPRDQDWMASLRDEPGDDLSGGSTDLAETADAALTGQLATVQELLEAQQAVLLAIVAKVDAMEASLADVAGRVPPVAGSSRAEPPPTVRDVVLALRQQATGAALRLRSRAEQPRRP